MTAQTHAARRPIFHPSHLLNLATGQVRAPIVARRLPESAERLVTSAELQQLALR